MGEGVLHIGSVILQAKCPVLGCVMVVKGRSKRRKTFLLTQNKYNLAWIQVPHLENEGFELDDL